MKCDFWVSQPLALPFKEQKRKKLFPETFEVKLVLLLGKRKKLEAVSKLSSIFFTTSKTTVGFLFELGRAWGNKVMPF